MNETNEVWCALATYSFGLEDAVDKPTSKTSTKESFNQVSYQSNDLKNAHNLYGRLVIGRFAMLFNMFLVFSGSL